MIRPNNNLDLFRLKQLPLVALVAQLIKIPILGNNLLQHLDNTLQLHKRYQIYLLNQGPVHYLSLIHI